MADAAADYQYAQQQAKARQQAQQQGDKDWKKYLDQNKGGKSGYDGYTTDFESAGGYEGLRKMIEDADPAAMMTVSQHWGSIGTMLNETAGALTTHVNNMLEHWTGDSADAFRRNAQDLSTSLTNGSQYARIAEGAMNQASTALTNAKSTFPSAPSEWDQITSSGGSDAQFHQDALKYGLQQALKMDGGDLSAWERVHQQAVEVMQSLGTSYNSSAAQMGNVPGGLGGTSVWPAPPASVTPSPIGSTGRTPTGPSGGGETSLKPITGGDGGLKDNFKPGQNGGNGYVPGGGGVGGIHGGGGGVTPPKIGGTLDGTPGGLRTGTGVGGGMPGGGGVGGVPGLGMGGGGVGGGAFGGGAGGLSGLGASGLGSSSGRASGEGANGLSAEEKAAMGAEGEGAGGAGQGEGMGMGGAGGLGSGSQKKKQRKARAGYLMEDEETWNDTGASNPGVIEF
ncbi:WXG100 family type VII secretion target [Streptacidiphilus neutrinimicus]|uniref:WXG100 family type VII secretion target n=1 Tax=Streptacidiphilus neutrinimicus TaxID=105420 RepID=UPI00069383AB|nr:hypothetical protein [Streptacidiphilus neutrinimicus]